MYDDPLSGSYFAMLRNNVLHLSIIQPEPSLVNFSIFCTIAEVASPKKESISSADNVAY